MGKRCASSSLHLARSADEVVSTPREVIRD